ncbi:hypothetical protein GUJ93_ZPchr0050g33544 [Zizania palustris]|uniref:Protein kinase domain-containing protein n=1 Tax=Zizania palustris TaxID=103762 RepID=A0A8J5RNX0_ZIZPA|nr:hypothetical protein GUJ93_ZPchr0050g33544 [Zizania palustris]
MSSSGSSETIAGGNVAIAIGTRHLQARMIHQQSWSRFSSTSVASCGCRASTTSRRRRHGRHHPPQPPANLQDGHGAALTTSTLDVVKNRPVRFSSSQLQEMTSNYAERLGAGGFGVVYKGELRGSGLSVAVKVLGSGMGKRAEEQFMAEIGTIGRTSHVNLARLYGFCFDADLKALVYECMPNGSLERYLFVDGGGQDRQLGFDELYRIAVGTAKAIRYLHDECARRIIHYDIKPGNVLLDQGFEPKVADFGLARLCDREKTHLTMTGGGRGTPGYAAPELWMPVPVTHKCDVYSYGMLLFEILGGRRNYMQELDSQEQWYPRWVWQRLERGETEAVVARARALGGAGRRKKAERMCAVALWCVQYRPEERPSMSSVVQMLEDDDHVAAPTVSPFAHLEPSSLHSLASSSSSETATDATTRSSTTRSQPLIF